jgi:hypothetical protein
MHSPGDPDLGTPTSCLDESSEREDDFACAESSLGLRLDLETRINLIVATLRQPRGPLSVERHRELLVAATIGICTDGLTDEGLVEVFSAVPQELHCDFLLALGPAAVKEAGLAALRVSYGEEARALDAFAEALDAAVAEAGDACNDAPLDVANEARTMAAAKRKAPRALATERDPLPEVRESRRTTRRCLNRRRAAVGMRPLPIPPPVSRLPNIRPRPRPRGFRCGAGARGAASRGGTRGSPLDDDPHEEPPLDSLLASPRGRV